MTLKILVTGGEGRFAKILKKKNRKLNLIRKTIKQKIFLKKLLMQKLEKL